MKTILRITLTAVFAVAMIAGCETAGKQGSSAQTCTVTDGKLVSASGQPMNGCVMMHHGKMMVMNGKLVPMKKNMTMPDGTLCMVNGTCVMKGGMKRQLAEGEFMSPTATIYQVRGLTPPGSHY